MASDVGIVPRRARQLEPLGTRSDLRDVPPRASPLKSPGQSCPRSGGLLHRTPRHAKCPPAPPGSGPAATVCARRAEASLQLDRAGTSAEGATDLAERLSFAPTPPHLLRPSCCQTWSTSLGHASTSDNAAELCQLCVDRLNLPQLSSFYTPTLSVDPGSPNAPRRKPWSGADGILERTGATASE
jgi:hypothetical protein